MPGALTRATVAAGLGCVLATLLGASAASAAAPTVPPAEFFAWPFSTGVTPQTLSTGVIQRLPRPARNRVYLSRDWKQTAKWRKLLPPDQRALVHKVDFAHYGVVVVVYVGAHSAVTITRANVKGNRLHLSVVLAPPSAADASVKGVYDVAALPLEGNTLPEGAILGVRRLVVDRQWEAPAPATDAATYAAVLGVPVKVDLGLRLELTPDVVYAYVTQMLLTHPYDPQDRIVSIEATAQIPQFILEYESYWPRRAVWKVQLAGRYPSPPPPCLPHPSGGSCPPPLPDFVDPLLVMPDTLWIGFGYGNPSTYGPST